MKVKRFVPRFTAFVLAALALSTNTACSFYGISTSKSEPTSATGQPSETTQPSETERSSDTEAVTDDEPDESLNGFITIDDITYYYSNGALLKDTIVGDDSEQFYYVNSEGIIDYGYCDGVTVDGVDWTVIDGVASTVETESDKTLFLAAKAVGKCTNSSMTKEEKLKSAFDYIKTNYLEGVPHNPPYREDDWHIVYANDIFVRGKGDCYSYGAAFAYMGKAMGCSDCYAVNSGGHGWSEIGGLIYDPEWSMHSNNYPYFAMSYDEKCDVPYKSSISDGAEWKRKEITIHG